MTGICEISDRTMGKAAVLAIAGQIDGSATGVFEAAYDRSVRTGPARRVVLDFAAVDYINSTGIALIVSVLAKARAEGRTVVATGLTEHYRRIFEITRLSDFIEVYSDVDEVVASANELAR